MLREKIANTYPDNDAGKSDVTNFSCVDDFVNTRAKSGATIVTKMTFCVREYRRYRGIYDVLYFGISVHDGRSSLISHFTMAGVVPEYAQRFLGKFIGSIAWK